MSPVEAGAPGKLLIVGEYAVLDGAPALVAAVDRRARVRLRRGGATAGRITCRPLGIAEAPFAVRDGRLVCDADAAVLPDLTAALVPRILEALGRRAEEAAEFDIRIDSSALFQRDRTGKRVKLGLGSSAAVVAAAITAFEAALGAEDRAAAPAAQRLARWLPVYRDLLGGRASGADLAAALAGGLVAFRAPSGQPVRLVGRAWPAGVHWLPVWVGRPAATTDFVAAFDRWKDADPDAARAAVAGLSGCAAAACGALGSPEEFLAAVAEYGTRVDALGRQAGIEIVSRPHRRLAESAQGFGVVYKSCGAGGGDLGIALSDDAARLEAFGREVSRAHAHPVNLTLSRTGAACEPAQDPVSGS